MSLQAAEPFRAVLSVLAGHRAARGSVDVRPYCGWRFTDRALRVPSKPLAPAASLTFVPVLVSGCACRCLKRRRRRPGKPAAPCAASKVLAALALTALLAAPCCINQQTKPVLVSQVFWRRGRCGCCSATRATRGSTRSHPERSLRSRTAPSSAASTRECSTHCLCRLCGSERC